MRKTIRMTIIGAILAASLAGASQALAVTATVPNNFVRTCSHFTGRCTGYHQTNGPYNWTVPSRYSTNWCWCWV